jgi:hypothetical protein
MTPGSALKSRLDKLSIYTAGGCQCKSLAAEMDRLGIDGCRQQRDLLAAKLKGVAHGMGYEHSSLDHFAALIDDAIASAEASQPPPVPINSLAVITSYFNPCGYAKPLENYRRFAQGIKQSGVPLYTIELAFDDAPFQTDAKFQIRGSSELHQLWQKERLLNIVIQAIGQQYDALAWVDADILFTAPDWADRTKAALTRFPVVQLFRQPIDLRGKRMTRQRPSTGSLWAAGDPKATNLNASHPGYAWAGRSDWLLAHGLEDRTITGGGDCVMAKAFCRGGNMIVGGVHFDSYFPKPWKRAISQWVDPVAEAIGGRLGFVDQTIMHLWHGSHSDRRYIERWKYLLDHKYDPAADVEVDDTGLLTWTRQAMKSKPTMVRQVREYFGKRREDG